MSFRPTIALYIQNEIADIRVYPEWPIKSLMIEAVTLGALMGLQSPHTVADCRRVLDRMRDTIPLSELQQRKMLSEAELRDEMQEIEAMSDYPVRVDLSAGCIYRTNEDPIPFKDRELEILQTVAEQDELRSALSGRTAGMVKHWLSGLSDRSR